MTLKRFFGRSPRREHVVRVRDEGEAELRGLVLTLVMVIGAPVLFAIYAHTLYVGLANPDALDYAQIARNLTSGHGFTTHILRPLAILPPVAEAHNGNPLTQPDVTHAPLYPFLLALAFGMVGANDSTVIGVSGLCYAAAIALIFLLGKRLFTSAVGWIAGMVFLTNATILDLAVSGTPVLLCTALLTGVLVALHTVGTAPVERMPRASLTMAAILAGLLYLTDTSFIWLVPIFTVSVSMLRGRSGIAAARWFLLTAAVVIVPWMIRNLLVTGNPVFGLRGMELYMNTRVYPGFEAYRMAPTDVVPSYNVFVNVVRKLITGAMTGIAGLPYLPAGWILAFFVPGMLFRFSNPTANHLRSLSLLCLIGIFLGTLVFGYNPVMLSCALPGLLVFAVAYLLFIASEAQLGYQPRAVVTVLLAIGLLSPLAASLSGIRDPATTRAANGARVFGKRTKPNEISFSDQPWIVAWYADRPSIWLPTSDIVVTRLRRRFRNVRWLFLTDRVGRFAPDWQVIYDGLYQWEMEFQRAREEHRPTPERLVLTTGLNPLLNSLHGFATAQPIEKGIPSAVVAVVWSPPKFVPLPANATPDRPGTTPKKVPGTVSSPDTGTPTVDAQTGTGAKTGAGTKAGVDSQTDTGAKTGTGAPDTSVPAAQNTPVVEAGEQPTILPARRRTLDKNSSRTRTRRTTSPEVSVPPKSP